MPELPEVETIANQLNEVLPGKVIADVEVLREKSFKQDPTPLLGMEIQKVWRRQKMVVVQVRGDRGKGKVFLSSSSLKNDRPAYLCGERFARSFDFISG